MTAGQRNCYIAIGECLDRYSMDDMLFAIREHVAERGRELPAEGAARSICVDVAKQLEQLRGWMGVIKESMAKPLT